MLELALPNFILPDVLLLLFPFIVIGSRLFCSMGAALRTDPTRVRVTEFWKVKGDALARALRTQFKKQERFPKRKFKCVYSEEPAGRNCFEADGNGSLMQVTAAFGVTLASLVVNDLRAL